MSQYRRHSVREAVVNTAIGLAVSLGLQYLVFPWFGIQVSHRAHLGILAIFTGASLIRGYAVRRMFNWWERPRPLIRTETRPGSAVEVHPGVERLRTMIQDRRNVEYSSVTGHRTACHHKGAP